MNQSIERAVRLLGFFSVDEPELTLAELTRRLGASKATTHRYATALRRAGLLRASGTGYTLGPRVVELAATALAGLHVLRIAGPFLDGLVRSLNQTVVMSVWDGEAPVVVRSADNTDRLVHISVRTGSRLPLESAQGQVFRAFLTTDAGPELERIRRNRLCYRERVYEGIAVLAAPVFQGDDIVATIAVVGTKGSIPSGLRSETASELTGAAAALSNALGFVDPATAED